MVINVMQVKNKSSLHRQRQKVGLLFSLPALVLVAAFLGLPIYQAMYYSMTKWDGIVAEWLGPSTYLNEFKNPIFWRVIENNALLLMAVPIAILLPMGIAYMLNDKVVGWKFFRTVYFYLQQFLGLLSEWFLYAFLRKKGYLTTFSKVLGWGLFVQTYSLPKGVH